MSRWAKLGVTITDLAALEQVCKKYNLTYVAQPQGQDTGSAVAILRDNESSSVAHVVRDGKTGVYLISMDVDAHYSPLARRIGADGGKMARDYSVAVVKKNASKMGGFVTSCKELADGSIVMKIARAA